VIVIVIVIVIVGMMVVDHAANASSGSA